MVEGVDGEAIFRKRVTVGDWEDAEERLMAMLYRRHVEFAVGHGVGVHVEAAPDTPERAVRIEAAVIPAYEAPSTTPPTEPDADWNPAFGRLAGLTLDMKVLAELDAGGLRKALTPPVVAYEAWIDREEAKIENPQEGLAAFRDVARAATANCRRTLKRIAEGLELLTQDAHACEAFRFMNRAMWLQQVHTLYAERVRRGESVDLERDVDRVENRSWRPFQIAFILLNLPAVTRLDHPDRSESVEATADLLFFPTGGGKTEAYLGACRVHDGGAAVTGNGGGACG